MGPMTQAEALKHAMRIIEEEQAEVARLQAEVNQLRWLLEARREEDRRDRERPLRVRFGPSPTFQAFSPEFPEYFTPAARRRQARGGIGP